MKVDMVIRGQNIESPVMKFDMMQSLLRGDALSTFTQHATALGEQSHELSHLSCLS